MIRPVVATSAIVAYVAAVALAFSCADTSGLANGNEGDATSDALPSEGGSPDAPLDVNVPADGGFCATHPGHTFCDDFETGELAVNWPSIFGARGVPVRDDGGATSPPFSLPSTRSSC